MNEENYREKKKRGSVEPHAPVGARDSTPQVSVIVPCYDKPEYLPECLESVRGQTFTDWECIVVSDGSPRVEEIRATVAAMNDDRFRLVEHAENNGPCAARNTGARAASGEYLAFLDSDDCLHHDFLRVMLAEIKQAGAGHFCACYLQRFGDEIRLKAYRISCLKEIVEDGVFTPAGGLLIKKEDYHRAGGFLEDPVLRLGMEDTEFWIRLIWKENLTPLVVETPLYFWRAIGGSLSHKLAGEEYRIRKRIVELYPGVFMDSVLRSRYIGKGYRRSSYAALQMGRKARAIALRLRGLHYEAQLSGWRQGIRGFLSFARTMVQGKQSPAER